MDCCPVGWLVIDASHPALAGHFPGRPIVPGVVLLDRVLEFVRQIPGRHQARVLGLPWVKFMEPVRPGQALLIGLEAAAEGRMRFVCRVGNARVAEGLLLLDSPAK